MRGRILEALQEGPRTVPEIAEAIGCPDPRGRLLGHGHAPLRLAERDQGIRRRRLLPVPGGGASMTALADLGLYPELQRYGATDMSACFSCGTCTAICPLSENDATFPRRMIRYAQVGMKDALLSSKELWSLLPLRRVLRQLPDRGRPRRVHGGRPPLRDRQLRRDPARPDDVPAAGPRHALRGRSWPSSSPVHVRRPRPAERRVAGDLRVHPRRAHPRHRDRGDDPRLRWPGSSASPAWPARSDAARASAGATSLGGRAALARSGRALWSVARARVPRPGALPRGVRDGGRRRVAWYRRRWFVHAVTSGASWGCSRRPCLDYGPGTPRDQGDRDAGADLVPGPPARHRRRAHARLRHHA